MDEFGAHRPSGVNRLILFLVRMGFGRGKLKRVFSRAWQASSPDTPVDFAYHGLRLRLRPVGNTIESKILFSSRLREAEELAFIRQYLTGGGCFVDIGANVGYYALMAAHAGATQVLAAEPNPELVDRFAANITLNGHDQQITILPVAIGAADDMARLHLKQGDTGGSSIVRNVAADGAIDVLVRPLATLLAEHGVTAVDAMKIDIEGMEDRALAPFLIPENSALFPRLLIIETVNRDDWEVDVLQRLAECGYVTIAETRGNSVLACLHSQFFCAETRALASAGALAGYRCRPSARCSHGSLRS